MAAAGPASSSAPSSVATSSGGTSAASDGIVLAPSYLLLDVEPSDEELFLVKALVALAGRCPGQRIGVGLGVLILDILCRISPERYRFGNTAFTARCREIFREVQATVDLALGSSPADAPPEHLAPSDDEVTDFLYREGIVLSKEGAREEQRGRFDRALERYLEARAIFGVVDGAGRQLAPESLKILREYCALITNRIEACSAPAVPAG